MGTGLELEGEAARKRFVVYWLRPGIAALVFGLFTFLVTAVPGEKEKIKLRTQLQVAGQENLALAERVERLETQVRELLPFAQALRAERLTVAHSSAAAGGTAHATVALDAESGQGVLSVRGIAAAPDQRAFGWSVAAGQRSALAAIDLEAGAGSAAVRVNGVASAGRIEITLTPRAGEPDVDADTLLAIDW